MPEHQRRATAGFVQARRGAHRTGASLLVLALACSGPALADTIVAGGSTPASTSTVAAGSSDNISQTDTLTVSSGAGLTLDSDNSVTNSGSIQASNVNDVTGILATGGHSGSVTNSGTITLNESATPTTNDSAGQPIGSFAKGSGRYGIRVTGPGTLTGLITNSGTITIQGADSAAISVEAPLAGSVQSTGTLSATGDRSVALRTTGPVSGGVNVTGASAAGLGAQAIVLGDDVGGGLTITGGVSATGYHTAVRSTTSSIITDQNANDAGQGGAAVQVGGSLGAGLLVSAPSGVTTSTDPNGDGIPDASEAAGAVSSYGAAPAILIGAPGRNLNLGLVGVGDSAYGVVIEGTVTGAGLRDGVAANGLQLGVAGGTVAVAGGLRVGGTLSASAYGADATALHLLAGAQAPALSSAGAITATLFGDAPSTARAVVIEPGGSLPAILNSGSIRAIAEGSTGSAAAIVDRSGSLVRLENVGTISALAVQTTGATAPPSGSTIAIDTSTNTAGLSLLSYQGAGLAAPTILGAVKLGLGDDKLDVQAGTLTGDISFGAGANSLHISGGANVTGAITADGGTLAVNVEDGSLQINNPGRLAATSLNLGAGSTTTFTVDPASGRSTEFDVAGAATILTGAKIGVRLTSFVSGQGVYALVRANQLNIGAIDQTLLAATPYLYDASLSEDAAAGTLSVTLARKTAAEIALPASLAAAYEPVLAAVSQDAGLSSALLARTTRNGFMNSYQQLLPEHSGGLFRMISEGVEAFGRPLDERQGGGSGGAWGQEVSYIARRRNSTDLAGYNSWGVGLIGGYERPATGLGIFGLTFGILSGEVRPHLAAADTDMAANLVELGGYWRTSIGRVALNARVAGDYLTAKEHRGTDFTTGASPTVGHWDGYGLVSRVRASYDASLGALYVRPQAGFDLVRLSEGAYSERGGGALDLAVARRTTTEISGFAGLAAGAAFGDSASWWGPEVLVGYRDALSQSGGTTKARFLSGGDTFTVGPDPIGDGGLVARVAIKNESGPAAFTLEAGGQTRAHFTEVDAKVTAHFSF